MPVLDVLRVFTGEEGGFGNLLGVFLDGGSVPEAQRQAVAADLGFSETVFVEDAEEARIRIFTPGAELPFAGHPCVGTAWVLRQRGQPPAALRPPAGEVRVRFDGELTHIAARPEWAPPFEFARLGSPAEVDAVVPGAAGGSSYFWAWEDEDGGAIRARAFFSDLGIAEDEATGAAAIVLTARLGRPLTIRQGLGSRLATRLLEDGRVEVGGAVAAAERRDYEAPG